MIEPELLQVARSLQAAQTLLEGEPVSGRPTTTIAGWFGPGDALAEPGATALARAGGPLESLVGEIVDVTRADGRPGRVRVLVVALAAVEDDLALSLRAFSELAGPWRRTLSVEVRVIA